jgi:hypothetical protein
MKTTTSLEKPKMRSKGETACSRLREGQGLFRRRLAVKRKRSYHQSFISADSISGFWPVAHPPVEGNSHETQRLSFKERRMLTENVVHGEKLEEHPNL